MLKSHVCLQICQFGICLNASVLPSVCCSLPRAGIRFYFVEFSLFGASLSMQTVNLEGICHCLPPPVCCTCLEMTEKVRGRRGFILQSRQSSPAVIQPQTVSHTLGGSQRSVRPALHILHSQDSWQYVGMNISISNWWTL